MATNKDKIVDFIRCKALLSKQERWPLNPIEEKELASLLNYFWVRGFTDEEIEYLRKEHWVDCDDDIQKVLKKYWKM